MVTAKVQAQLEVQKKKKKYQKQKGGVILGGAEDRTEKQIAWIRKKFT
jgi:hypothetical protein